jgi:hypothetical protein
LLDQFDRETACSLEKARFLAAVAFDDANSDSRFIKAEKAREERSHKTIERDLHPVSVRQRRSRKCWNCPYFSRIVASETAASQFQNISPLWESVVEVPEISPKVLPKALFFSNSYLGGVDSVSLSLWSHFHITQSNDSANDGLLLKTETVQILNDLRICAFSAVDS